MFLFSRLIFKIIFVEIFTRAFSNVQFYVQMNNYSGEQTLCDGSSANPFPDLLTALLAIEKKMSQEKTPIELILQDPINIFSDGFQHLKLFETVEEVNLKITTGDPCLQTTLKLPGSLEAFSLLIKSGSLVLENICLEGNSLKDNIEINIPGVAKNVFSKGFINLESKLKSKLVIKNCLFSGVILGNSGTSYSFLALIYLNNAEGPGETEIMIEDTSVTSTLYPQGLIYSNSFSDASRPQDKHVFINITNMKVADCSNRNFLHWKSGFLMENSIPDYFDFVLILNNTNIYIRNLTLFNSSRFMLANKNSFITLEKILIVIPFDVNAAVKSPPEIIYLIDSNIITIDNLTILNSSIYSYDDKVDPNNRDVPLMNMAIMMPASLLKLEKNQAVIGLIMNNFATFTNILIQHSSFYKKENFLFSVFGLESKNKLIVINITLDSLNLDTESRIGVLCVFESTFGNEFHLKDGRFTDLNMYGYALVLFSNLIFRNFWNASNLVFLRTYFKTKSNDNQIKEFLVGITINPNSFFVKNSAFTMLGGTVLLFIYNNFINENIFLNDTLCLYGCFISAFYKNSMTSNKIVMKQAMSVSLSSSYLFGIANILKGKNLVLEDGRAYSGVIYGRQYNEFYLEDCKLISNWGMGGFAFIFFSLKNDLVVCGNIGLGLDNRLSLKNSIISNGYADLTGGAINFKLNNIAEIELCIFLENESSSSVSDGGAFYAIGSNSVVVKSSKFINNYGTYGGALYADSSNTFIYDNCTFERNQGEVAAGILLNKYNTLKLNKCSFTSNQGFVRGGLFVINGGNQTIYLTEVSFIGNQAPFKGNLIEISENNTIIIKRILVDYDKSGNGNFLFLNRSNLVVGTELEVRNIMRLEIFIFSQTYNRIDLLNSTVKNNEWIDSFIFSASLNKIYLFGFQISNITISESASGFLNLVSKTDLIVKNISFNTFSVKSKMVITAVELNKMEVENLILKDTRIIDQGSCFSFLSSNFIEFKQMQISDFLGFSNDVFLFDIEKENTLLFNKISVSGYFSMEQVWKFSCVFHIIGDRNTLNITDTSISSENPSFLKVESLFFFKLKGQENLLSVKNSKITLINYVSFLDSDTKSFLDLSNCNFENSELFGDLITLRNQSLITFFKAIFHQNSLREGKTLLLLRENVAATLKKITSNTNSLFLKSSNSAFNISKSSFVFKSTLKQTYSSPLMITELGSVSFLDFTDIILRENKDDSIILVSSSTLHIKSSSFGFNKAITGGVLKVYNRSKLVLESNTFYGNEALLGGVLYFVNSSLVSISRNFFLSNRALSRSSNMIGKGGCIYASLDFSDSFIKFEVAENKFTLGGAEIGGIIYFHENDGANYFLKKMNFFLTNALKQNQVRYYGKYAATYPSREIKLVSGVDLNREAANKIKILGKIPFSKSVFPCIFQLVTLDFFNQTAYGERQFRALQLFYNNDYSLDFSVHNSFLCFSALKPNSSISLNKITDETLKISLEGSMLLNDRELRLPSPKLEIELNVRKCSRGEYFDLKLLECFPCEPNFFSFEKEFTEAYLCKSCLTEPFYCYGGFNLTPKAGYWRRGMNSVNFIKCPNPQACLGDQNLGENDQLNILSEDYSVTNPQGSCGIAYEGILCNKCRKGFAKTGGEKCAVCSEGLSIFLMVVKILLRIFLYYYTIYKAVMMSRKVRSNKMPSDLVYSNFLLKILILHFQFLKAYTGFPFMFPSLMKEVFNVFSFSISSGADKVLNLECFIDFKGVPVSYVYSVINIIAPLLVVSTLAVLLKDDDDQPNKSQSSSKRMMSSMTGTCMMSPTLSSSSPMSPAQRSFSSNINVRILPFYILISLMLSYDEVLGLLIHNFSSINIDDNENPDFRIVEDFEIDFFSDSHQTWIKAFALPATIIIGIMLPSFIIYSIFRAREKKKLKSKTFLLRFGYFFFAYDDNHLFYELVYIMRKVFLFAIDTFFIKVFSLSQTYNPITFSILICLFYTSFSILALTQKPYKKNLYPALNHMENLSVSTQALTAWVGSLILSVNYLKNESVKEILNAGGFLIILIINIGMLGFWVSFYWKMSIAVKFKTAIKKMSFLKKKGTTAKLNSPTIKKKETVIIDEITSINKEMECEIFIPPHLSSRWSSNIQSFKPETNMERKISEPFIIINENEVSPLLNKSWIDFLWERFNLYKETNQNSELVKILFSKWDMGESVICSKELKKRSNRPPVLRVSYNIRAKGIADEDEKSLDSKSIKVSMAMSRPSAFFLVCDYEYDKISQTIKFIVLIQINEFNKLALLNHLQIDMHTNGVEFLSSQIQISIIDFLEVDSQSDAFDKAFCQLSQQGVHYSSESRFLSLSLPSERLRIEIIRSKYLQKKDANKEVYYYRELKHEKKCFLPSDYIPQHLKYIIY